MVNCNKIVLEMEVMNYLLIFGIILLFMAMAILIIAYVCFRIAFLVPNKNGKRIEQNVVLEGAEYDPYRENIKKWAEEAKNTPHEVFEITSFDGLTLRATYYEYKKGAPIEIMFHGYRGNAERDLSGGMQRCFMLGRSALIVDQRACGRSEGNVITFGINEYRDCLKWVDFVINKFGKDVKIILCGISMGASTVLMAAGQPLPENVIGVLADCGYNSAKDIIKKVIKQLKLPAAICYPFVKLGARLFGNFDLEELSPEEALKNCKIPVIFFHGEADDFVPCEMSKANYNACASKKRLVTVPKAAHGLSYPVAPENYLSALREFFA